MREGLSGMRRAGGGRDGRIDGPIPSWRLDDLLLQEERSREMGQ